jgi:hypothetical protein
MSKAKQNTFLIGYFSALAVGAAGLGYLAFSSWSASTEAQETYDKTKAKLQAMLKAPIFPKMENVDAKKKQVDAFVEQVKTLNDTLRTYQTPLATDMNSSVFQSKLQKLRDGLVAEAKDAGTKLPANFDLGMGAYLSSYPVSSAVPRLDAELDGIHYVVSKLISNGVKEINSISRPELAFEKKEEPKVEEAPKGKAKPAAKPAAKGKGEPPPPVALISEKEVLERYPFAVTFTASSRALNEVMTLLANTSAKNNVPFFYNIRVLRIENEQKTGADTSTQITAVEETDPVTQKPFKRDSAYIFGVEKVQVHLGLDLIRFPEAAAPAEASK